MNNKAEATYHGETHAERVARLARLAYQARRSTPTAYRIALSRLWAAVREGLPRGAA